MAETCTNLLDCDNKENESLLSVLFNLVCVDEDGVAFVRTIELTSEECTPLIDCETKEDWDVDSLFKSLVCVDSEGNYRLKIRNG